MGQIPAELLTEIELLIFRLNGQLLRAGDRKVARLDLTSARWQMLGAIRLAGRPCTAPQLAERMGVSRQGAQKQLNLLAQEALVMQEPNPAHARSPLYRLTERGAGVYSETEAIQASWAGELADGLSVEALTTTLAVLSRLSAKLG